MPVEKALVNTTVDLYLHGVSMGEVQEIVAYREIDPFSELDFPEG